MGKKVEKERNEIVEEFFRMNDPKNIKSMNDMYTAWKDFFAPAFQQLLDAEMEAKIGYSKNERTDNNNYRNGYYPERTVATEKSVISINIKSRELSGGYQKMYLLQQGLHRQHPEPQVPGLRPERRERV